jgi:hypothetical protein
MADDETRPHRVLTADDVHVRSADRCSGNAKNGFSRTRFRLGDFFDRDVVLASEDNGFHRVHIKALGWCSGTMPSESKPDAAQPAPRILGKNVRKAAQPGPAMPNIPHPPESFPEASDPPGS